MPRRLTAATLAPARLSADIAAQADKSGAAASHAESVAPAGAPFGRGEPSTCAPDGEWEVLEKTLFLSIHAIATALKARADFVNRRRTLGGEW